MLLPARKDELFSDSRRDLDYIAEVISTALGDDDWSEVVREFEDECCYLSILAAALPGDSGSTVWIEFGVQDEAVRRATGGFVAGWSRASKRLGALEIMILDGNVCGVSSFAARLASYAGLPATISEMH